MAVMTISVTIMSIVLLYAWNTKLYLLFTSIVMWPLSQVINIDNICILLSWRDLNKKLYTSKMYLNIIENIFLHISRYI